MLLKAYHVPHLLCSYFFLSLPLLLLIRIAFAVFANLLQRFVELQFYLCSLWLDSSIGALITLFFTIPNDWNVLDEDVWLLLLFYYHFYKIVIGYDFLFMCVSCFMFSVLDTVNWLQENWGCINISSERVEWVGGSTAEGWQILSDSWKRLKTMCCPSTLKRLNLNICSLEGITIMLHFLSNRKQLKSRLWMPRVSAGIVCRWWFITSVSITEIALQQNMNWELQKLAVQYKLFP